MRPIWRSARRRDERGSILPMTAILLVVFLAIGALAVDLGVQRAAASDVQAVADIAALDAARELPTCDNVRLTTVANQTKGRHKVLGEAKPLTATAGHIDATTRKFVAGASGGVCDAVRVTSSTEVVQAFAGGKGSATRSAVGTRGNPTVCFSLGTKTLTLNTSTGALGPLLDHILRVNMSAVGYQGLVNLSSVRVPLADLDAELTAGGLDSLVDAPTVSLGDLIDASVAVAQQHGALAGLSVAALNQLLNLGAQLQSVSVDIGDILDLGTGGADALSADIDLLDLVGAAVVAANGSNAVAANTVISLPANLSNAAVSLSVIEPPKIACGSTGATARSAQVRLNIAGDVLNALGLANVKLGLDVQVGQGAATLGSVTCAVGATNPSVTLNPVTTAAASVIGTVPAPVGTPQTGARLELLNLSGIPGFGGLGLLVRTTLAALGLNLKVDVGLGATVAGGGPYSRSVAYPNDPGLPATQVFGSNQVLTLQSLGIQLAPGQGLLDSVLGIILNPVLNLVTNGLLPNLLNNVLNPLLSAIVTPLLNTLGIKLGVTEVDMLGRPECTGVKLVGG